MYLYFSPTLQGVHRSTVSSTKLLLAGMEILIQSTLPKSNLLGLMKWFRVRGNGFDLEKIRLLWGQKQ